MVLLNALAIILVTIISITLGMLWYGPIFGKQWMRGMDISPSSINKKPMKLIYLGMTINTLVLITALAYVLALSGTTTALSGLLWALLIWIGFIVTTLFEGILWENKKISVFFINAGYRLVMLAIAGLILGFW